MKFTVDIQHKLLPELKISIFGIEAENSAEATGIAMGAMFRSEQWKVVRTYQTN